MSCITPENIDTFLILGFIALIIWVLK